MKARISRLAAACILSACAMPSFADWAQEGGDAAHTSYVDVSLKQTFSQAWRIDYEGYQPQFFFQDPVPVAAVDGIVLTSGLLINDDGTAPMALRAIDLRTGQQKWQVLTEDVPIGYLPMVTGGGKAYTLIPGDYGYVSVSGYDLQTGQKTLSTTTPGFVSAPAINATYSNGHVYYDASGIASIIQSVNTTTGARAFAGITGSGYEHSVAIVGDRIATFFDDGVKVYDTAGTELQHIQAPRQFPYSSYASTATPTWAGEHLIAVDSYSTLIQTFDLGTGALAWSRTGGQSDVAVAGNEVFVVLNGVFTSLNLLSGSTNWTLDALDARGQALQFGQDIIATANTIFVAGKRVTYIIDRTTHQLIGTLDQTGYMAFDDETLLVSNQHGLYAYAAAAVPEAGTSAMAIAGVLMVGISCVRRRRHA